MKGDTDFECKDIKSKTGCGELKPEDLYNTKNLGNFCLPKSLDDLPEKYQKGWEAAWSSFQSSAGGQYVTDITDNQDAIGVSIVMSVVYSLVFIYFMSAYAE